MSKPSNQHLYLSEQASLIIRSCAKPGGFLSLVAFLAFLVLTFIRGKRAVFVHGPGQAYLIVAGACPGAPRLLAFALEDLPDSPCRSSTVASVRGRTGLVSTCQAPCR